MPFPVQRLRRTRRTATLRGLVRETRLSPSDLVYPIFVTVGEDVRNPVSSMPGVFQLSINHAVAEAERAHGFGIPAILLFGIPDEKDEAASGAYDPEGIVQLATRAIKEAVPELLVITDVCLCEYMSHGHCGVVEKDTGQILNDISLELLARTASSQAEAGADIVAPSDMMDGRVAAIRSELDIEEGADIVMVKPALPYLDVVRSVKEVTNLPLATYSVSGEYAMIKAAAQNGWLDERAVVLEALTGIKRAGADIIISYYAPEVARWLS